MSYKVITFGCNVATSQGAFEFSGKPPKNLAFFYPFLELFIQRKAERLCDLIPRGFEFSAHYDCLISESWTTCNVKPLTELAPKRGRIVVWGHYIANNPSFFTLILLLFHAVSCTISFVADLPSGLLEPTYLFIKKRLSCDD